MSFVRVEKNQSSAPSEVDMKKAMVESGGKPGEVTGTAWEAGALQRASVATVMGSGGDCRGSRGSSDERSV